MCGWNKELWLFWNLNATPLFQVGSNCYPRIEFLEKSISIHIAQKTKIENWIKHNIDLLKEQNKLKPSKYTENKFARSKEERCFQVSDKCGFVNHDICFM